EAAELFPQIHQVVAASDTLNSPGDAVELVRMIETNQVDLIIGTQIIAKGYHFPMLTLVGVVDGDLGLAGGDLRAGERTYQLLFQVAGRAGREQHLGRVMLQTSNPDHGVMRALAQGDRAGFLEAEAKDREAAGMPPFGRLVGIVISGRDETEVDTAARAMRAAAPRADDLLILGPAPAPLSLLRGRHRRRLLLKARRGTNIQEKMRIWLSAMPRLRKVRIQVDIDPYSFL
ncbi:MAG: primosomal protein N', partial [Rhodospirillales bacterium]|nr:primosomal protein N' [Rhodospirillales bacterium]